MDFIDYDDIFTTVLSNQSKQFVHLGVFLEMEQDLKLISKNHDTLLLF